MNAPFLLVKNPDVNDDCFGQTKMCCFPFRRRQLAGAYLQERGLDSQGQCRLMGTITGDGKQKWHCRCH
jgi:hypothetical protein